MVDINQFRFTIESRHPKFLNAYDASSHSYKPEYISPTQWHLKLSFDIEDELRRKNRELDALQRPQPPIEDERPGRHPRPQHELNELEEEMEALNKAIADLEQTIQAHDFWFRVEKIGLFVTHTDGSQSVNVMSTQDSPINALHPIIRLTQQGKYRITSFVKRKNIPAIEPKQLAKHMTLKDILICTIGDSYACGEGNPDEPLVTTAGIRAYADMGGLLTLIAIRDDSQDFTPELELATWQEPLAHRSYKAGHTLAAEATNGSYADMQVVTTHLSVARSGASIHRGLIGPNLHIAPPSWRQPMRKNRRMYDTTLNTGWHDVESNEIGFLDDLLNIGQIQELEQTIGGRRPDFLLLTIGGNDCGWINGFTKIIETDLFNGAEEVSETVLRVIDRHLENDLIMLDERLSQMPQQPRHILLTLYPLGFFGDGSPDAPNTNRNCGIFDAITSPSGSDSAWGIDDEEAIVIKKLANSLNNKLREFVANQNIRNSNPSTNPNSKKRNFTWHIVEDIDTDFESRGYCSVDTLFLSAEKSFLRQNDWNGIMHPNERGHDIYARRISKKIRAILNNHLEAFRPKEFHRVGDPTGGGFNPSTTTKRSWLA